MTNTINSTDTVLTPMEETMTGNERTTLSRNLRNERNEMNNAGLCRDKLQWLETCDDTGRLTEEGKQQYKMCLEAALHIDPKTAEVKFEYVPFLDPYRLFQDVPNDQYVMRRYFARSPGSNVWVDWDDLPEEVEDHLLMKHKKTDPALRDPFPCWASFCHSRFFRKNVPDTGVTANHVRYIRVHCFGGFPAENRARRRWQPVINRLTAPTISRREEG